MIQTSENTFTWKSPSNIALIKYWGKHGNQLPINPSLSITLRQSTTTTGIAYEIDKNSNGLEVTFRFEGQPAPAFGERIHQFLSAQTPQYPELNRLRLNISSSNTFPHSSGIASSASAFSALALGILSLVQHIRNEKRTATFFREASELSRLGSGSASRSVYGGYVVWGAMEGFPSYSDRYAAPMQGDIHPVFRNMQDAILIVNAGTKKMGSSAGHRLMHNHPFARARVEQAITHMHEMHKVLESGLVSRFIDIVENEALSLHGLMMSSRPGYLLIEKNTIDIIEEVRSYRESTGSPVCFTLDAGPNVHLLYPESEREKTLTWIHDRLLRYCHQESWIDDGLGEGPIQL